MALEKFSLAALSSIDDGRIAEAFAQALHRCESDCQDRPAVDAPRKINIEIQMSPLMDPQGNLDTVDVSFVIKDNVPKRQSKTYNMQATRSGLLFNELSADDVKQRTLDDAPGPRSVDGEEDPQVDGKTQAAGGDQ